MSFTHCILAEATNPKEVALESTLLCKDGKDIPGTSVFKLNFLKIIGKYSVIEILLNITIQRIIGKGRNFRVFNFFIL